MLMLVALTLAAAAEKKDEAAISVDQVTVNGEPTVEKTGKASGAAATVSNTGQQWSVVTARTVGEGANDLQGAVGFPGVSGALLHGMTSYLDLGGRITLNYGWEGQVSRPLQAGLKLQALAKVKFFDNGKVNAGAAFAPGLLVYFPRQGDAVTHVGMALPVSVTLGITVSSAIGVGVTVDLPMWVRFGTGGGFVLPILMGAGLEYFITSALAVWFDLRMGPSVWTNGAYATQFTMDGKLGVGWRF